MTLTIFPAIDLRAGRVVRLRQGDPNAQTTFGADPAEVARRWVDQGAAWLHVVDLDGALAAARPSRSFETSKVFDLPNPDKPEPKRRQPPLPKFLHKKREFRGLGPINLRRLAEIRAATAVPIQFGGGLRTIADVGRALALGATRVVLGTVAVRQPEIVGQAVAEFGAEQVVVGIDAREGRVATHGWQETSALDALTVARRMRDLGVVRVVYTDIARDGTLTGVNLTATAALARDSRLRVIASGGVASLADIRALAAHASDGIEGVIVGQALYTGAVGLREAILSVIPAQAGI